MRINKYRLAMIMSSCLMVKGKIVIKNVPGSPPLDLLCKLIGELGCHILHRNHNKVAPGVRDLDIQVVDERISNIRYDILHESKLAFYVIGPLLARRSACQFSITDTVPTAVMNVLNILFLKFGIYNHLYERDFILKVNRPIKAGHFQIGEGIETSLFTTFTAMTAATRIDGVSYLEGVSEDPHINAVIKFLSKMGLEVSRPAEEVICIKGGQQLTGCTVDINEL